MTKILGTYCSKPIDETMTKEELLEVIEFLFKENARHELCVSCAFEHLKHKTND